MTTLGNTPQKIEDITISGNTQTISYNVNYSDFNNEKSGYIHAIWCYDKHGNRGASPYVYVESDEEAPVVSNIYQDNFTSTGYTLHFTVSDNKALDYIKVFTWTGNTPQKIEDITLSGSSQILSYNINYSDFNNEKKGYINAIWCYDKHGNRGSSPYIYVKEPEMSASPEPTVVPMPEPSEELEVSTSPESTVVPTQKPDEESEVGEMAVPTQSASIIPTLTPSVLPVEPSYSSDDNRVQTNSSVAMMVPAKVEKLSLKFSKKKLRVKWKKVSGANGYEVWYSTTKKFKKKKTTKKVLCNIKNLKGKKTYYVKVRAYTMQDGKKNYGKWSKVKKIKK